MRWDDRIGRRLKLRDLHILMSLAQSGSMGKAASELSISQPAVSKAIADVEHTLKVRLLDRTPLGVEPTRYGHALLKWGNAVFDDLRQSVKEIEYLSESDQRRAAPWLHRADVRRLRPSGHRSAHAAIPEDGLPRHAGGSRHAAGSRTAVAQHRTCGRANSGTVPSRGHERRGAVQRNGVRGGGCRQQMGSSPQGRSGRPDRRALGCLRPRASPIRT